MNRLPEQFALRRRIALLALTALLLTGCSLDPRERVANVPVSAPANQPVVTPIPIPCQRELQPGEGAGGGVAYMPGDEGVMGCVADPLGRPISYARPGLESWPLGVQMTQEGLLAGEDGRYHDSRLTEPGWYTFVVYADGYEPATKRVEVRRGQTAVLDFVLEPLPAATATALAIIPTPAPPVVWEFPCQSETRGGKIRGSPATYPPGAIDTRDGTGGGIYLMGCIREESGKGIAGATTTVRYLEEGYPGLIDIRTGLPVIKNMRYRTGEDGRYIEPNIAGPGWWEVTATAPGYANVTKRVLIPGGDDHRTAVLDFVLQPER